MKRILFVLAIVLIAGSVMAQLTDKAKIEEINNQPGFALNPAPTPFSLIDLSRIKWSNSYTISYFSGGNNSGSVGILNSSLLYEFSSKLSLAINIGVAHNPGNLWGDGNSNAAILPSFQLDYRPSKNLHFSIGMHQYQGYWMPYSFNRPLDVNH